MASRKPNGASIAAMRKLAGITQTALAVSVGIDKGTMSRIEAGADTKPATVRKIADTLGVPLAAITYVVPEPDSVAS